ncbi:MAG: hypothetical protein AB1327_08145 [Bacillota bacterium]
MSRNIGPIPGDFSPSALKRLFIEIQRVLDNLTGQWLQDSSVTADKLALAKGDISPGVVDWPEWHIPLALPASDAATTSTTYVRCSGIFPWDPAKWNTSPGSWYLEAYLAIAGATATVTCHLMGAAEVVGSVLTHTGNTSLTVKRSGVLTMPNTAANLYVEFMTSNATYAATFAGARLVFVPS